MRKAPVLARMMRRYLTPREKAVVLMRQGGGCNTCGRPGPFVFDHIIQLWMIEDRAKANHIDNFQALCRACDKPKTAKDAMVRAKTKRIRKSHGLDPVTCRPRRLLRSRRMVRSGAKIGTRGFDKRFKRKVDGTVEKRE